METGKIHFIALRVADMIRISYYIIFEVMELIFAVLYVLLNDEPYKLL